MAEDWVRKDYFDEALKRNSDEFDRVNHRLKDLEDSIKKQAEMNLALERLTINLSNVLNQLEAQSQRLKKLEEIPLETNKKVRDALVNTIVGGVIGAVVAKLLTML